MDIGLTGEDIEKLLGFRPSIMMYKSLSKFLDDPSKFFNILKKKKVIFVLYPTVSVYNGHWCVIIKNHFGYEFFDPYGLDMDNEKLFINPISLVFTESYLNYLKLLFLNTPYIHNKFPFQQMKDGINTCGRWCVHRALNKPLSNQSYIKKVLQGAYGYSDLDKWITKITPL